MLSQHLGFVPHSTVLNGISSGNEIIDVTHLGEPQNTLEALVLVPPVQWGKGELTRGVRRSGLESWLSRALCQHFPESLVISSKPAKQLVSISTRQAMR